MADCYCDNVSVEFSACSLQVGSLCNTKFFSLACIAHCCRLSKHSSYLNIFLCLRLSLWGMLQRFPVSVQDFFFGQDLLTPPLFIYIFYFFKALPQYVFTLCFALVLREKVWLIGGDRWLFKFGLAPIPPPVLQLKVDGGGEGKRCRSISQRYKSQRHTSKTPELSSSD